MRLLVSQQVCNWTFLAVGQGFAERTVMVDSDQCQGIPAFNLLENILWSSMRVYDSWVEQLGVVNYKCAEVSLNWFIHLIFLSPSFCWFLLQTPIFPAGLVWCKILKCWSRCWKQHPTVGIPQITTSRHLVIYEAHFCGKTLFHFFSIGQVGSKKEDPKLVMFV